MNIILEHLGSNYWKNKKAIKKLDLPAVRVLRLNQLIYFNINLSMETQIRFEFIIFFQTNRNIILQRVGSNYWKYRKLIKKLNLVAVRALRLNQLIYLGRKLKGDKWYDVSYFFFISRLKKYCTINFNWKLV